MTLDRLHIQETLQKIKLKVNTRNDLLRKLVGSTWGFGPYTVRTTVLSLCFSAGKNANAIWCRSTYAKKIDIALNETCCIIMGCLKNTESKNCIYCPAYLHLILDD